MGYIQVEIDSSEVIDSLTDSEIFDEYIARKLNQDINAEFENLYYALRDRDIDRAIEIMNPILDESIGRMI